MALDSAWVDQIHARLLVRFGARWTALWAGIDPALVKLDWAEELDGLGAASIRYALDNLPADWPPTVAQFKALCLRRPASPPPLPPPRPALAGPKPDPARVREALAGIARKPRREPRAWARELRDRELHGEKLTGAQRVAWRTALHNEQDAVAVVAA
jgi:hypothetical protein